MGKVAMGRTWVAQRENDRWAVRFKVRGVEDDWPEEGGQEDNWACAVMSAVSWTVWERSDVRHRLPTKHPWSKQMCDCRSVLVNWYISFISYRCSHLFRYQLLNLLWLLHLLLGATSFCFTFIRHSGICISACTHVALCKIVNCHPDNEEILP